MISLFYSDYKNKDCVKQYALMNHVCFSAGHISMLSNMMEAV